MKQQRVSLPKQDGRGDLLPSGYISLQSVIRHQRVKGREIHQNSLCSVRYTKEPLRIRDGLLCLWPSTLGAIPSSPQPAWCELIIHSGELTWKSDSIHSSLIALPLFAALYLGFTEMMQKSQTNARIPRTANSTFCCVFPPESKLTREWCACTLAKISSHTVPINALRLMSIMFDMCWLLDS